MPHENLTIVPGRVVAVGDLKKLRSVENRWYSVRFLREPDEDTEGEPRAVAILETSQLGRELEMLLDATSLLGELIRSRRALVDFDYPMTYAGLSDIAYQLGSASRSFVEGFSRSPHSAPSIEVSTDDAPARVASTPDAAQGSRWSRGGYAADTSNQQVPSPGGYGTAPFSSATRRLLGSFLPYRRGVNPNPPIGVVDSGLDASAGLMVGRSLSLMDLSQGLPRSVAPAESTDVVGHGTRVARILESVLHPRTGIVMASLGPPTNVTASAVVMAMTCCIDGLPGAPLGTKPSVVSMSLWPAIEGQHSVHQPLLIPFMASRYPEVAFVMSAGNYGIRFAAEDSAQNLLFGVALDELGMPAAYSSRPIDSSRALIAFGGSDAVPFFDGPDPNGTSWATPLLSSALLSGMSSANNQVDRALEIAFSQTSHGWMPDFHPPTWYLQR